MPDSQFLFPSPDWEHALMQTARCFGVQDAYWDIWGREHHPVAAVQSAILESMGVRTDTADSLDAAARQWLHSEKLAPIPASAITDDAEPWVPIAFRTSHWTTIQLQIGAITLTANANQLEVIESIYLDGQSWTRAKLSFPADIPYGEHTVILLAAGQQWTCRLTHCPSRTYNPPNAPARLAGIAVSLYGLRSNRNWGCGDFTDLVAFGAWAKTTTGAEFVALNPLHAIANRTPYNTSPYLPASTYYRNFIYLDIEQIPEYAGCARLRTLRRELEPSIASLRASEFVDYEGVARIKVLFLKLLYREFLRSDASRRAAFDKYRRAEGTLLEKFATYCALDEYLHRRDKNLWIWPDWPEQFRDPSSPAVREFARFHWRRVEFWQFVFWLTDEQCALAQKSLLAAGMSIGLYHDLALATDRCGSDLWAFGEFYSNGCRVGAPPDDFSPKGQDWSFPPPNARRHRDDGYRQFAAAIRNNSRHGGALRIDHVMRFFRLYWIPAGYDATEGTYVREQWRDLLRIVALESHRNRVMIIGEDLGTVEDYVRQGLSQFSVFSYRLLYFERAENGRFKRPDEYPENAVISSTTHDLPTIAGWWLGRDIESRRAAGLLLDETSYHDQVRNRLDDKHKLLEVLHDLALLPPGYPRDAAKIPEIDGDLHHAIVGFLASAPARLFVLNQEDLTKETEQQNLPGSTWEYPNWRRKMKYSIEQLHSDPVIQDFSLMLRNWLAKTGRLAS